MAYSSFSLDFLFKFLFSRRAGAIIKIIAWLSVAGIGVGVASLVIVLSVMNGFNQAMRAKRFSVEPHLVVYFDKMPLSDIQKHPSWLWLQKQKDVSSDVIEQQDVLLRSADGFVQGGIAQGMTQAALDQLIHSNRDFKNRKKVSEKETQLAPNEVFLGGRLGDDLGVFEEDRVVVISPETWLNSQNSMPLLERVKVKNFIRTDLDEIDAQKMFYIQGESLARLRQTASLERFVEVRLPNPENYLATKKKLESYKVRVDSWKERNSNLFYSLKLEKFVVGLLLGLSTMIASFSLVTVLTLLTTQKKKDIGLLLSLGMAPIRLRNVFLKLGLMLASLGVFGGATLGVISCFFIGRYSKGLLPQIYEDTSLPTDVQTQQVLMVIAIAMIFSLATTWLSVRKLSKVTPVQALR